LQPRNRGVTAVFVDRQAAQGHPAGEGGDPSGHSGRHDDETTRSQTRG